MTYIRLRAILNNVHDELSDLVQNGKDKKPGMRYKNIELCSSVQLINKEKGEYIVSSFSNTTILDTITKGDFFTLLGSKNSEIANGQILEILEIKID